MYVARYVCGRLHIRVAAHIVMLLRLRYWEKLDEFEEQWPVLDMCKIRLKHSASRSRAKQAQEVLDAVVNTRKKARSKVCFSSSPVSVQVMDDSQRHRARADGKVAGQGKADKAHARRSSVICVCVHNYSSR